ncbi:cytidylate kinase-like family protein [Desulfococcaceae bacterium HSG8]|nr:cytidylate kinase-like family protein [Desulfococcaceae bacterium HSG8]
MPLITISRNIGCGGAEIARSVAAELDLELYDDQRLQEEALKMGLHSEDLKSLDEKAPGLFDRILNRKPELYFEFTEAVVYKAAKQDSGVILGHGSQLLLRDFGCAFHVLIHTNEPARIENMVNRQGVSRNIAKKLIRRKDNEQKGFFRFAFQRDWDDPSLYDLIINTEKLGNDLAAKLITGSARSEDINACSLTATEAMERLSGEKKLQAILLKNEINMSLLHIEVFPDGKAYIGGVAFTKEEKDRITEVTKDIPGVSDIQTEISLMPQGV